MAQAEVTPGGVAPEVLKEAPVPASFFEYVKSWGPGIVIVLTWLGAGDLVDSSVAGANYGYALMWGLAVALLVRFGLVHLIAKFPLFNTRRMTLLAGFRAIHPAFPTVIVVACMIMFHFYNSYAVKGTGSALMHITGIGDATWGVAIWSIVGVAAIWLITNRHVYGPVEKAMMVLLAMLVICLVGGAIWIGPNWGGIAGGVVGFAVPAQVGIFGSLLVVVSLIGAVGGSVTNVLYPYFMRDKGWTQPKHRRVQIYDLLFGVVAIIILDLAVWIMGAEVLNPQGLTIESVEDMAGMLNRTALGNLGSIIFYLGVIGATFSTTLGLALGGTHILKDLIKMNYPKRLEKYPNQNRDPWVLTAYYWIFLAPLVWALPGMPGFVWLTIIVNAASLITLPLISIGILVILNRTDLMGEHKNGIIANLFLFALTLLALYGAYHVLVEVLPQQLGNILTT
ncbi:MAG: Nramp family divalent metal transporter [Dehalococcoidales bacterium]|nr:Nramp family divalent metal transporter [Dehalococcoidales bacterium]